MCRKLKAGIPVSEEVQRVHDVVVSWDQEGQQSSVAGRFWPYT